MRIRHDSWTEEHDAILVETIVRFVKEGKTRLQAFEEAAEKLERTVGACTFRWNATVREKNQQEVEQAKRFRRMKAKGLEPVVRSTVEEPIPVDAGISYEQLKEMFHKSQIENRKLLEYNQKLERAYVTAKEGVTNLFLSL